MARIRIQSIVERIDSDLKRALEDTINQVLPNAHVDRNELYRAFNRAVGRRCSTWVTVPDNYVDNT